MAFLVVFGDISEEAVKKRREEGLERLAKKVELNHSIVGEIFWKRRHDVALELAPFLTSIECFCQKLK